MALPKLCSIEGCDKPERARGWCVNHYALWQRNGAPVRVKAPHQETCAVQGCESRRSGRLYCGKHDYRFRRYGDPLKLAPPRQRPERCRVAGCSSPVAYLTHELCSAHYQRWRKRGDPEAPRLTSKRGEPIAWLCAHVAHTDQENCLTWPFARHSNGEAAIGDRRSRQAARLMCIFAHGEPPFPNAQAAHNCGKGHLACVNPNHLRWATPKENTADQIAHGTRPIGSAHPRAKLTEIQVRAVRALSDQFGAADLAEIFGVHVWTITDIVRRRTWAWLR